MEGNNEKFKPIYFNAMAYKGKSLFAMHFCQNFENTRTLLGIWKFEFFG